VAPYKLVDIKNKNKRWNIINVNNQQ